jgi:excisionase family DNA binding protein
MKDWYSTAELAEYLGLSEQFIRDSDLPSYRFGRIRRYRRADIEGWLAKRRHDQNAKVIPLRGTIEPSLPRRAS